MLNTISICKVLMLINSFIIYMIFKKITVNKDYKTYLTVIEFIVFNFLYSFILSKKIILLIIISFYFYKRYKGHCLKYFIYAILVDSTIDIFLGYILPNFVSYFTIGHFIVGFSTPELESEKINLYTYSISLILLIITYIIVKKIKSIKITSQNYIVLVFALFLNFINITIRFLLISLPLYNIKGIELQSINTIFNYFISTKLIICSSIMILIIFKKMVKYYKINILNQILQEKSDMKYNYYLNIQDAHIKVKKLYHDMTNHLSCIENLKEDSEYRINYINSLKHEVNGLEDLNNSGNVILDIILSEKNQICKKKNINFNYNIDFSEMHFVDSIDVCSIFSNILDNAIEACDKIHNKRIDKYINIKGTINKKFYIIKCENSKVNNLKIVKNNLLTDKSDNFVHGLGLKNIKSAIHKYDGELIFNVIDHEFTIQIFIPLDCTIK